MRLLGNPKKIEKYFWNFLEPGNQEPRSPRKSWGAILVPDAGGSKKIIKKTHVLIFWSLGTKNQDPPESVGEQSWFRILVAPKKFKK